MDMQANNPSLHCPQCGAALAQDARTCSQCGVDLFLITLMTERAYLEGFPGSAPIADTPEAMVPRIGEYLVDQKLISADQLASALDRQKTLRNQGQRLLLGQTLVQMGFIETETLDKAINHQIIGLNAALREANRNLENRVAERTTELRSALARLTEVNQIKANLISNVSHELRTPLAHIKGYVELISDGDLGELSALQKNAMDVMRRSTHRLEQLIQDLIQFSTASKEGINLDIQPTTLFDVVTKVFLSNQRKAAKASISLENELPDDLPLILADPQKLEWVINHLVDNGIKFTPEGGCVKLGCRVSGESVRIYIKDTGIGIPEDRMDEIFIPFHQLDGSASRRYGGTGLGLALAKHILDGHETQLVIESTPNVGSIFSFSLPIATEKS